jgi:hypothetical protein
MRHRSAKGLFALLKGSFRECVVTRPDMRKERVDGVYEMDIGHWRQSIDLDIKCCTRSRPGVVLGQGYKYKPLMSVIGIEHLHNKNRPRAKHRVL